MLALSLIPIIAIVITFCVRYSDLKEPCNFTYEYYPTTIYNSLDHKFIFSIEKLSSGYRCYVKYMPSFRGRKTTNYQYHLLPDSERHYVCWTGKIKYSEQAKKLCRNWADATQQFIDTGVPAPGFER